jgi:hypothetical protein
MVLMGYRSVLLGLLGAALGSAGCTAAGSADAGSPRDHLMRRDTEIHHEPCEVTGPDAEGLDANGDGAPDVVIVRQGGREVCRAMDFNFDGRIDAWVYLDAQGRVRRRENDYDRDGRIDEILLYSGGRIVQKQRATTLSGRLDTWHYYEGERLKRTERDSDGDAVVDQWWEYPKPDRPDCPVVHVDVTGNGRPDPGVSVDVCADQVDPVVLAEPGERRAFDFDGPAGALPREVKEEETPETPPSGGSGRQ